MNTHICLIVVILSCICQQIVTGFSITNTKFNHVSRKQSLLKGAMIELELGAFEKEVTESSEPVFVDFMANWCGPCKLTAPIFKDLAKDFDNVKFVKVDTDIHEDTVDRFNLQGLPLFALFINGKVVASHSGAISKEPLKQFVLKHLAGSGGSSSSTSAPTSSTPK